MQSLKKQLSRKLVCIISFAIFAASLFAVEPSVAANIEISGNIQEIIYNTDGTQDRIIVNLFHLKKNSNDNWECLNSWGDYAELLAFDGTNTYAQQYYPTREYFPPTNSVRTNLTGLEPLTTGEIRRGSSCVDGLCTTRLLWLAYLGKPFYLKGNSNSIVVPWGDTSILGADSLTYKASWLDNEEMVPSTLQFIFSDALYKSELDLKHVNRGEESPFKDGNVVAEYKVNTFTNTGEEILPTEFEMNRYAMKLGGSRFLLEHFVGSVSSVQVTGSVWKLPPLHMRTQVLDFRFSSESQEWLQVTYKANAGIWPTTNEPMVTVGLAAAISNYPHFEKMYYSTFSPKYNHAKVVQSQILILMVVIIAPLLMYIFSKVLKRTTKTIQNKGQL
jgi:hypothetical protein